MKTLFADEQQTVMKQTVMPEVDFTKNNISPISVTKPTSTALSTHVVSTSEIDALGDKYAVQLSGLSTKMLTSVRASDAEGFGSTLNQLVATAKGMDPNNFKKKGVLSKLTNLFGSVKEKMLAQYETVEKRMDELITQLDKYSTTQSTRIGDLEQMFVVNYQSHQGLEQAVQYGGQLLVTLNEQVEQAKAIVNPDNFTAQNIADLNNTVQRLEKKIDDLKRVELLAKQAAPEIRLLQDNARTLVDKFKNIKDLTIPAWKQAFTLYLVQLEQKAGAELANAADDATNEAFRQQADMLRQNTQEIAKAKQRSVIDLDTLQHVQDQLLGSFDDMDKIAADGRKARQDAEPKIKALEQQLITRFTKSSN